MVKQEAAGPTKNCDELSTLLGVDPKLVYEAIRAVGVAHAAFTRDAGEQLFPNSIECLRMMRGFMRAFGSNEEELRQMIVTYPAAIAAMN